MGTIWKLATGASLASFAFLERQYITPPKMPTAAPTPITTKPAVETLRAESRSSRLLTSLVHAPKTALGTWFAHGLFCRPDGIVLAPRGSVFCEA